jgi:hypothetical protein
MQGPKILVVEAEDRWLAVVVVLTPELAERVLL